MLAQRFLEPGLAGEELVDAVQRANETFAALCGDGGEQMFQAYVEFAAAVCSGLTDDSLVRGSISLLLQACLLTRDSAETVSCFVCPGIDCPQRRGVTSASGWSHQIARGVWDVSGGCGGWWLRVKWAASTDIWHMWTVG